MALIKSISGIRGTIGGVVGENLTPLDTVKFAAAYGAWLKNTTNSERVKVVVGRDARISGQIVNNLVCSTLQSLGINIVDVGLSTTPTVEVFVPHVKAQGGIILTASHNPKQWNALKLLNAKGEFLSAIDGAKILEIAASDSYHFSEVDSLGDYTKDETAMQVHIDKILNLDLVDAKAIRNHGFNVVIDAVNSTGGIALPMLFDVLNVKYEKLYCDPNGHFPHNPEPLEENLAEIMQMVPDKKADLGIVVDPDVDRLALINEDGSMFGEEYTLVAVADYILQNTKTSTVSNLSSSRALRDITNQNGESYFASAVGEVNVVEKMKKVGARIGGEGNGGIIFPELHYGRDSLVGIALILTYLAKNKKTLTELKKSYNQYYMSKKKIALNETIDVDALLLKVKKIYEKDQEVNTTDGVKIDFAQEWIHLRKSNTEPIIRIYTEALSQNRAEELAEEMIQQIQALIG